MRGISRFSVDYFMSHSTQTFVGEPFNVPLISGIEKVHAQERVYHDFLSKIFPLIAPKNFVGKPSMSQKIWGIKKFYG